MSSSQLPSLSLEYGLLLSEEASVSTVAFLLSLRRRLDLPGALGFCLSIVLFSSLHAGDYRNGAQMTEIMVVEKLSMRQRNSRLTRESIEHICRKSSEVTLRGRFNLTLPPGGTAVQWMQSGEAVSRPWTNELGLFSSLGITAACG